MSVVHSRIIFTLLILQLSSFASSFASSRLNFSLILQLTCICFSEPIKKLLRKVLGRIVQRGDVDGCLCPLFEMTIFLFCSLEFPSPLIPLLLPRFLHPNTFDIAMSSRKLLKIARFHRVFIVFGVDFKKAPCSRGTLFGIIRVRIQPLEISLS